MKRTLCLFLFWMCIFAPILMAQETPNAPIGISDTELHSVTLTNVSPKSIVSYILQLNYEGLTGRLTSRTFWAPNGPNHSWAPGATWRHEITQSSRLRFSPSPGAPAVRPTTPPRVELTYVLFSDGTSWGTDPEGKYAEDMCICCRDVNQFLKELWKQKGIGAVEDYLRRLP